MALEALGVTVQFVKWRLFSALWFCFIALFDRSTPFQCAIYSSNCFRRAFDNILIKFTPDVLYLVTVRVYGNIKDGGIPIYLDLIDSMGLNFLRRRQVAVGLKRAALAIEHERIRKFEIKVAQASTQSFVVSELDRGYIDVSSVTVLPLGTNLSQVEDMRERQNGYTVVFSGNMNYRPNIEAVIWFVQHCWHQILTGVPQARFIVTGSNPAPEILALRSYSGITVTGRVDSIASVLNASQVAVAPMQSGSGMQFKVLEAMACRLPVVATTIGLGDIGAMQSKEILVGDSPNKFSEAVIELLKNASKAKNIGCAGFSYVNTNHKWDRINKKFAKICQLD